MGNSIEKYGVTICCDGWDDVQNRPLPNIVQCGTKEDVFLGTIDTTGNHKDHTYVAPQIQPFVQMVGGHNVVQVCIDNALVLASVGRDVMQSNPHMYVQGCATHCLDLLLEDLGKEKVGTTEVNLIKWDRRLGCACSIGRSNSYMATSKHDGKVFCSFYIGTSFFVGYISTWTSSANLTLTIVP